MSLKKRRRCWSVAVFVALAGFSWFAHALVGRAAPHAAATVLAEEYIWVDYQPMMTDVAGI